MSGASAPRELPRCSGCSRRTTKEAPVSEEYDGRQVVGIDLHRRRSVIGLLGCHQRSAVPSLGVTDGRGRGWLRWALTEAEASSVVGSPGLGRLLPKITVDTRRTSTSVKGARDSCSNSVMSPRLG